MRGETVLVDNSEKVQNVLVHNGESSTFNTMNAISINDWVGPYADYILYFPISYNKELTGRHITVRGYDCEVIGHPDHERPDKVFDSWQGKWDMQVRVRKILASKNERIKIVAIDTIRDSLGNKDKRTYLLFDGSAQARQETANESNETAGTVSNITYYFVVDWLDTFKLYQTQQLQIQYNGKTFDVVSIEDKNEEKHTAVFKAVWNG